MAEASIPVDLFNPGQVFACMGFLEAADVLLGQAMGGFDWTDEVESRFTLCAAGDRQNPFEVVLEFLSKADVRSFAHRGFDGTGSRADEEDEEGDGEAPSTTAVSAGEETFPATRGEGMALPIRLVESATDGGRYLSVTHWADGSSRNSFKLYSGNRSAAGIAQAMLQGTRKKAKKKSANPELQPRGLAQLWEESRADLIQRPFEVLTPMGGSFNFDPRGAWTAIDAGYSPNDQKHSVEASPVVEILAAIGLEYARPDEFETREVRYGVWKGLLPPALARPALGGSRVGVPIRIFWFTLDLAGKNKIVTFGREETYP